MRHSNSPLEWGEQLAQVTFIIVVSLLVNELSTLARAGSPRG